MRSRIDNHVANPLLRLFRKVAGKLEQSPAVFQNSSNSTGLVNSAENVVTHRNGNVHDLSFNFSHATIFDMKDKLRLDRRTLIAANGFVAVRPLSDKPRNYSTYNPRPHSVSVFVVPTAFLSTASVKEIFWFCPSRVPRPVAAMLTAEPALACPRFLIHSLRELVRRLVLQP